MEMTADFIAIQGLLSSVIKSSGDFTKIKYKGGNEMKINQIIKELEDYLVSKKYINKRITNKTFQKELDDITFFLILYLDFKDKNCLDLKEFAHLMNAIPTLSKCVLAHIVIELNLSEYYCNAIHKLPIELSEELISEIIPCIKNSKAETSLELAYIYLKNIIRKISSIDMTNCKVCEGAEKLEKAFSEILLNCSGINPKQTQNWQKVDIYKHMGHTLLCLFKLLQHCQVENDALLEIIHNLINSICSVMEAVTVHVFCTWAEVEYKNAPLQTVIAEEAYLIIEKFQKHESAKPLIQMLSSIAKKPKTLKEMIQEANSTTMINKIELNPTDRKKWFTALLNTQVFQSKESMDCINRWANLCSSDDLERLLYLSVSHKGEENVIQIIMKCASFFGEDEIAIITTRFFYQHGLKSCLSSKNTSQQLTITLNKLEKESSKEPVKDVLLLFLQNPELVLTTLYRECTKNLILLESLTETFKCMSYAIRVEKLFLRVLEKLFTDIKLDANNLKNVENLFKVIAEDNYKELVHQFVLPQLENYLKCNNHDDLYYKYLVYKEIVNKSSADEVDTLIKISTNILEKCRWKIFDFTNIRAAVCEEAVLILTECRNLEHNYISEEFISTLQHLINKYYIARLTSETDRNFLDFVCPNLNLENHAESVAYLMRLLPLCTQTEWIIVKSAILEKYQSDCCYYKFIELITDILIIISEITTQQSQTDNGCILNGLKFCIQNYGLYLKDITSLNDDEVNVSIVKNICRLLRKLPTEIMDTVGLSLITLVPDKTLKGLVNDDNFIAVLLAMKGSQVCRVISKRMVS